MNADRQRLLAPSVFAGLNRETAHASEAAHALDIGRNLVARVQQLDLHSEEIAWLLAEALLLVQLDERKENGRRIAREVSSALSGARAQVSLALQTRADEWARKGE